MHPLRQLSLFAVVTLAPLSCCSQPSVGYQGPIPSSDARRTLGDLEGQTLPAGSVAFTSKAVRIESFVVGPNAPTVIVEEMPFVEEHPPAGRHWIPVFQDGDIADLHRRATGKVPTSLAGAGAQSEGYRRMMTGR